MDVTNHESSRITIVRLSLLGVLQLNTFPCPRVESSLYGFFNFVR